MCRNRHDLLEMAVVESLPLRHRIPLAGPSVVVVDKVVSTFILCTIPGAVEVIRGIRRVLKPGGKFVFLEHGLSPESSVQRWQKRTEPLFRGAFEGCHLTRDIPSLIGKGGFTIDRIDAGYVSPFPSRGRTASGAWRFRTANQQKRYCLARNSLNRCASSKPHALVE
jgi:SAM-dependent methyltransferase